MLKLVFLKRLFGPCPKVKITKLLLAIANFFHFFKCWLFLTEWNFPSALEIPPLIKMACAGSFLELFPQYYIHVPNLCFIWFFLKDKPNHKQQN